MDDGIYFESDQQEGEARADYVNRRIEELRGIITEQLHALWDRCTKAPETDSTGIDGQLPPCTR